MSSKLAQFGELESILCNIDNTNEGILHFFTTFKITRFLSAFGSFKTKGFDVSVLLLSLLVFRLRGESINRMQNRSLNFLEHIDDNTIYRLMNNPWMDWRKLLIGFAKQFLKQVKEKGDCSTGATCFVLDDTDIEKTGKKFEFISKIFNHVSKLYPLGYKLLVLAYWDGKSLIATDCSLHCEKGKNGKGGLSAKESKSRFCKKRDNQTPSHHRVEELNMKKGEVAISMLKRAVKNGFIANYVLMDSWFVNDQMIKSVRGIKKGVMHILGMCKLDKRKYLIANKSMNAKQLIIKNERKNSKYSRKYKSFYIPVVVDYKGEKVRLFFIKYKNSKTWTLLLTSDLTLSFVQAIELYQIRWTIEVMFKECKQYLHLGSSQNTDFDGQIADVTITLVTHTILTLQKRFSSYETMGELFRETQQHMLELTLWERLIKILLNIVIQLAIILNIDSEEIIEKLMQNDQASKQLLTILKVVSEFEDKDQNDERMVG